MFHAVNKILKAYINNKILSLSMGEMPKVIIIQNNNLIWKYHRGLLLLVLHSQRIENNRVVLSMDI